MSDSIQRSAAVLYQMEEETPGLKESAQALVSDTMLWPALNGTGATREEKEELIRTAPMLAGKEQLTAFVLLLLEQGTLDSLPAILRELRQLELAREIKKPVIIHSRDAAKDTVDLMTEAHAEEIGGVIHCYSYTKETAKIFLDMGFYFGIGGVLTFKNAKKLKEAVEYIPMDRIVLETDCPYLAPEPNRGKRNSSLNIPYVIAAMAQIKGITEEEVRKAAWDNSLRLYHIEK